MAVMNTPERRAEAAASAAGGLPLEPYGDDRQPYTAQFTADGKMVRPVGWRDWPFIGTPLTPNALNPPEAPFPEFHAVYIEPTAWEHYKRTGEFMDGTILIKELIGVQQNDTTDPDNGSTVETSGRGYFMSEYSGLEAAVKDPQRFANEPGNWAYFSFGHVPETQYADETAPEPVETCNACHAVNAAQDYVFAQHYPVLRGAKARVS